VVIALKYCLTDRDMQPTFFGQMRIFAHLIIAAHSTNLGVIPIMMESVMFGMFQEDGHI
jgi:hypothetical protein